MEKCVNVHKSPVKNVMMCVNIHIKNVNDNDVDFDANMNYNMCMKVILLFIDIKFCIVICIIYVHDAVDVSAYEYVNVYADVYDI